MGGLRKIPNVATSLAARSQFEGIVLLGSTTSRTSTTPAQFSMPAFAWRLSDQEAADIISFVRSSWGNDAKPIEAPKVAALRSSAKSE